MKMNAKLALGIALAMAMNSVSADDTVYYLQPNEGGYAYTAAFTNAALWKASDGTGAGEAGAALSPNKVFAIQGSKSVNTVVTDAIPDTDAVFTGKRLECGTSSGNTGRIRQFTHGNAKTSWDNWGTGDGLKLYRGYYQTEVANVISHIYGKMEVVNYGTAVWEFRIHKQGSFLHLHSDVSSAGGAKKNLKVVSDADGGGIYFDGSLDGFYGDILTSTTDDCGKTIGFGTTTLANRLQLCTNCTLTTVSATDVFKVGKLESDKIAGIKVKIAANEEGVISAGQIVITNSVTVENGPVIISTDYVPTETLANAVVKPIVFAKGVNFNPADFVWQPVDMEQRLMYVPMFVREEDGSASFTLTIVPGGFVKQKVTDSRYASISANGEYRSSSITNAANWSDGFVPHSGANYLVSAGNANSFALRTEADAMLKSGSSLALIDYPFPGKSLAIDNKSYFVICCSNITIDLLRLFDGSTLIQGQYTATTLNGKVSIEGNSLWNLYSGNKMTVKSELIGDGEIKLTTIESTDSPNGQLVLDNLNSNFTGRICVSQRDSYKDMADFDEVNQTLNIKDGRALGGAGLSFDPKALTLERYGSLCALETTTVSEPTRGTWINGIGRFKVENGKTLTYSAPLAVNGTFCKEGQGLLALANGQPKFGETALAENPGEAAENRTFLVREGNVMVSNAYALNGLDIVVEDPAAVFVFDAGAEDAELLAYGIVNTLTPGSPFAVQGEASKIKIGFTVAEEPEWPSKTIGICTVKKAHAQTVAELIEQTKLDGGFRLRVESVTQHDTEIGGEECVTFKAKVVARYGTVISVK